MIHVPEKYLLSEALSRARMLSPHREGPRPARRIMMAARRESVRRRSR